MPGKPLSTSTSTPESSPMAGSWSASRAASALSWAFSAYVAPISATSGSTATNLKPVPERSSRYSPSLPALPVAMTSRCSAKGCDGSLLAEDQLLDALVREREHRIELRAIVRNALRGRLQLDEALVLRHHTVQIGGGLEVFGVVKIEPRRSVDDAAAHRGEILANCDLVDHPRVLHALDRHVQRAERTGNRSGARAAISLQHIAIEGDRPLADLAHVNRRAQRPADQPLNLMRPAADATLDGLPRTAVMGRARQHRVLSRDPSMTTSVPVRRYTILDARRDPNPRAPHLDEARALGVHVDAKLDLEWSHLGRLASVRSRCPGHRPLNLRISELASKKI